MYIYIYINYNKNSYYKLLLIILNYLVFKILYELL